jgi:formamidopyrimidine-DNA glycosylase
LPELPELELVAETLARHAAGRTVQAVVLNPKRAFVIRHPLDDFARELTGRKLHSIARRGKFVLFEFADGGSRLVINPMLGGRFALASRAAPEIADTCFTLQFDRALDFRFVDSTLGARIYLTADPEQDVPAFADLGPDALDPALTLEAFLARLKRHRGEIKNVLRNQVFVSGIGNAYSDEVLFAARLRPFRRVTTLSDDERRALYSAMRGVLAEAVATVKRQYAEKKHPLHKQDRSFMKIHSRNKAVCPRCCHRVSSVHAGGDGTYYCRGCQL